jgi:hypothetical protein
VRIGRAAPDDPIIARPSTARSLPTTARKWRLIATLAMLACVIVFAFFEVRLHPEFSLPREVEKPDPAREALYERCVAERTDEATRRAFEAADNPDVQSLMIRIQQMEAIEQCRRQYPEEWIRVSEPLRLNLIDLSLRFGDE